MTKESNYGEALGRSPGLDDDQIDLRQLLLPVWHRKWSILSLAAVVMMLATLVVLNMTPIYQAGAKLLIEQRSNGASSLEEIYGLNNSGSEYLQTQFELLKSRELAVQVVDKLGLTQHPEFDPRQKEPPLIDIKGWFSGLRNLLPFTSPEDLEGETYTEAEIHDQVVSSLMNRTTISPIMKTQLVEIKVAMADRVLAAEAANALAEAYIQSQLAAKLSMSKTATSWMNEQLADLKINLQKSEERLQMFREQENLVDVEGVATLTAGELTGTSTRLQEVRRQRAELESQHRQVTSVPADNWRRLASVPAVLSDPLVKEFRTAEAQARSKVEEYSRVYGPKYPKMIAAKTELESASDSLREQVAEVVDSIERKYQLALANERALETSLVENKGEMQDISRKGFQLRELEREVETNRQLYETFLTRLKETSASQDLVDVNARVAESAVVPKVPVKPNKQLIVIMSGILAMLAGAGLVWLNTLLSNTFKNTEDVENQLNLPVLGVVPLIKSTKEQSLHQLFDDDNEKGFAEAVRTLRTSIVFSALEHPCQVIVVTSSVPGEGKTTLSTNLASALGATKKALLVESDLRRPNLRKVFGRPVGTPGVANYLAGTAELDECIQSVSDGLDLLVAGTVPPNPQELLVSPRFGELMKEVRGRYEYIVVDSPPSLAVSDAVVLGSHGDSLIYVVKANATKISEAQRGVGHLLQKNAPVTGVVLNQVDLKKAHKYGYSYSGYYDYYGYSSSSS